LRHFNRTFEGYTPSKNKMVREAADFITKLNKNIVTDLQAAGSTIKYHPGYVFAQTHNADVILKDVDYWVDFVMANKIIDPALSFGAKTSGDLRKSLKEMAMNIEDLSHGQASFLGGKKSFIFTDGHAFDLYNKEFGHDTLLSGVQKSIEINANRVGMVQTFGNRPRRQLDQLIEIAKATSNIGDLNTKLKKVDDALAILEGVGDRAGTGAVYSAFKAARVLKTLNMYRFLGKLGFTSLQDLPTAMLTVRMADGSGVIESFGKTMHQFVKSFGEDKAELARMLHIGIDDIQREVLETIGTDYKPGAGAKAVDIYMTMNMGKPITRLTRTTTAKLHANIITETINMNPKNWNAHRLHTMEAIGITPKDAANLQKMLKKSDSPFITADMPLNSNIGNWKYKRELSNKLGAYFNHVVSSGSPTLGAKESRIMMKYFRQDDWRRVALEILFQFKGTLLRSGRVTSEFANIAAKTGGNPNTIRSWHVMKSLGQFGFAMATMGYAVDQIKNAGSGRDIELPTPQNLMKGLIDTGTVGVYLDAAVEFGTRDGRSRGIAPVLNMYDDLKRAVVTRKDRRGHRVNDEYMEKLGNILAAFTPGKNLWFIELMKKHTIEETASRSRRR